MSDLLPVAGRIEAEARRDRIKAGLSTLWDDIKAAWRGRDWLALGYQSWSEMCEAEYRLGLSLPASERPEVVADLRAEGMSTRAIASATGVSAMTVQRDLSGVTNVTAEPVVGMDGKTYQPPRLAVVDPEVLPADVWMEREGYTTPTPHVANNSGNNEWYTPPEYINAARTVLGNIDLDPATSTVAQSTVAADMFYTAEDDGLAHQWHGRVWLNPPYSQPLIGQFVDHLAGEYLAGRVTGAVVLTNNGTETGWGQTLMRHAAAVCFPTGRIRFLDPEGQPGAPLQGQMVTLLTDHDPHTFAAAFAQFGPVMLRG